MKTCFATNVLNNKKLDNLKRKGYIYFKDEIFNGKRNICFSKKKYSKDEVDPYTTNPVIIAFRKLGNQVLGIGKLK